MAKDRFLNTYTNILNNPKLREPQLDAYIEVYNHFVTKKRTTHAIVVLPTGSGKTGLIAILPYNISKGRVLIIAPQLTILDTIESSLDSNSSDNFWSERDIITNPKNLPVVVRYEGRETKKEHMESADIIIANIQRLQSRNEMALLNQYDQDFFDMIIIDEAHHAEAKTWLENLQHFSQAKVIKITATAYRTDKKQLVGELVYKYKLSQAMSKGYVKSLEKFDYIPDELYFTIDDNPANTYTYDEIVKMDLKDEEWISRSVVYSDDCKRSVVKESLLLLNEKRHNTTVPHKIIAAAPTIEDAKKITVMYQEAGYRAVAVHNKLDSDERKQIFSDIDNHRVDVVVNVAMMGEGYDHKYLSIAAIFRAFKNPLPYEQFIGRILRVIPEEEVKKAGDNIGSVVAHNLLFLDDLWEYYKSQLQESDFIKELEEQEFEDSDKEGGGSGKIISADFGQAHETGEGILKHSVYLDTDYFAKAREEQEERKRKIAELSKLLEITEEDASRIIEQQTSARSELKRPDVILKHRKKVTDTNIREVLVPELLLIANVAIGGNELASLPIFKDRRYQWIPSKIMKNGGMLATYFNTFLKNSIGYERDKWTNEDYERAGELLEQQAEYLKKFFDGGLK